MLMFWGVGVEGKGILWVWLGVVVGVVVDLVAWVFVCNNYLGEFGEVWEKV